MIDSLLFIGRYFAMIFPLFNFFFHERNEKIRYYPSRVL